MNFARTCLAASVTFVITLVCGCSDEKSASSAAPSGPIAMTQAPVATAPKPPAIILPAVQIAMLEIVTKAQADGAKVENDMQLGGVKASRDSALCSTLKSLVAENWVGKIQTIDSNSDGKGVLSISIAPDVLVKTWNNGLSDMTAKTLIEPGTPLFTKASGMKRGDLVSFSGIFINGKEGDCLREASMRLKGKVLEPEFIFRFDSIDSYAAQQAAQAAPASQPVAVAAAPVAPVEQIAPTAPAAPTPPAIPEPVVASVIPPVVVPAVAEVSVQVSAPVEVAAKAAPVKPSFDCAKAGTLIEELICNDPDLSALDAKMATTYRAARGASGDEAGLKSAQLSWLKNERNKCTTSKCLSDAYTSRLVALGN